MLEEPPLLQIRKPKLRPTQAQIDALTGVETGMVCDAMEGKGSLDSSIRALGDGERLGCNAVGPALTCDNGPADMLAVMGAVNIAKPGDVIVAGFSGHTGCALVGDRLMGICKNKGCAGFVTDGPMRDFEGIVEAGLPGWCNGLNPASPYTNGPGWVGFPVQIGGQIVETGDMIVADRTGVVVVPFDMIDKVIKKVKRVKRLEKDLDKKVREGFDHFDRIDAMLKDGTAKYVR